MSHCFVDRDRLICILLFCDAEIFYDLTVYVFQKQSKYFLLDNYLKAAYLTGQNDCQNRNFVRTKGKGKVRKNAGIYACIDEHAVVIRS